MKYTENELKQIITEGLGANAEYFFDDAWHQHKYDLGYDFIDKEKHTKNLKELLEERYAHRLTPATAKVGDGATVCLWSDQHAATIIKVTKASVTVRYDKATRDPNFKPEFVIGGFAAHCTNQEEQTYTYEPDENGAVETYRWSNKECRYGTYNNPHLIAGRHEFYDYNF